jgi:hypothetical protein
MQKTEQQIANTSSKNAAKLNILHDRVDKKYTYKEIKSRHTFIAKHVEEKKHKTGINNEIKFWYTKKQNLNKTLYNLHIPNGT